MASFKYVTIGRWNGSIQLFANFGLGIRLERWNLRMYPKEVALEIQILFLELSFNLYLDEKTIQ